MTVETKKITFKTKKEGGMVDLTSKVKDALKQTSIKDGTVTVFCPGSTGIVSTVEYEPGLQKDVPEALSRIAPDDIYYKHTETWHDDNGKSHVKATLVGPDVTVPIVDKQLTLGTWQQLVFIECDTRDRKRTLILQFIGE